LNVANLKSGRPKRISDSVKTLSPKIVFTNLGSRFAPVFDQEPLACRRVLVLCAPAIGGRFDGAEQKDNLVPQQTAISGGKIADFSSDIAL